MLSSSLQALTMKTNIILFTILLVICRASSLSSLETKVNDMVERMTRMEAEMEEKDERIAALEAERTRVDGGGLGWYILKIWNLKTP